MYTQNRNKFRESTSAAAIRQEIEVSLEARKTLVKILNHINKRRTFKEAMPNQPKPDLALTASNKKRAETLLDFFASDFTITSFDKAPEPVATLVMTFLNDISFSTERVRKELDNLIVAKSGGPDLILPRIFYEDRSCIEETLSHVFELPWDTGKNIMNG